MSEPTADVLFAIEQADVALGVAGLPEHNIFRKELREAIAAVTELIEADREFDLAVAAVCSCTNRSTHFMAPLIDYIDSSRNRLEAAKARRAAALARIGGAK